MEHLPDVKLLEGDSFVGSTLTQQPIQHIVKTNCIIKDCKKEGNFGRQLCVKHYQFFLKCVKRGVGTWKRLEDLGLCLTTRHKNDDKKKMKTILQKRQNKLEKAMKKLQQQLNKL